MITLLFSSSRSFASLVMVKSCKVAGFTTFPSKVSQKSSRASSTWCGVDTVTFLPQIILMSKSRNVCFYHIVWDILPNVSSILSAIIELILSYMCETLLLSTIHPMVHWCSLINLFAIHCSYGLSLNPKYDSVVEKNHTIEGNYLWFHISTSRSAHTVPFCPSHV